MTPSTLKCLTSVVAASLVFAACDGSLLVFARVDAGPVLLEGDSGITCSKSTTSCGGTCVVTQDDNANCGACGVKCLDSEQCANSRCFPKNCPGVACGSQQVCSRDVCTGVSCLDVQCGAGERCAQGVCEVLSCSDVQCGADERCVQGVCEVVATVCDGGSSTDVNNCGACGHVCATPVHAGARCSQARCGRGACEPGFYDLDGEATPGCESTCVGAVCTLPDGGTVTLSEPPARSNSGSFVSGGSSGVTVMSGGGFRNTGIFGTGAASSPSQSPSGEVRHVGALTSFGK